MIGRYAYLDADWLYMKLSRHLCACSAMIWFEDSIRRKMQFSLTKYCTLTSRSAWRSSDIIEMVQQTSLVMLDRSSNI